MHARTEDLKGVGALYLHHLLLLPEVERRVELVHLLEEVALARPAELAVRPVLRRLQAVGVVVDEAEDVPADLVVVLLEELDVAERAGRVLSVGWVEEKRGSGVCEKRRVHISFTNPT